MGVGCGRQETRDVGELAALLEGGVSRTVAALACVRWLRGPSHVSRFSLSLDKRDVWSAVRLAVPGFGSTAPPLPREPRGRPRRRRLHGPAPAQTVCRPRTVFPVYSPFAPVPLQYLRCHGNAPSRLRGERIGGLTPGPGSRGGSRWPRRPAGRRPSSRSPAAPPLSCLKLCRVDHPSHLCGPALCGCEGAGTRI